MARRFETLLKVKPRDNLGDPEFWNRRWDDTDRRIAANEDALSNIDEVANRVESVALDRINNVVTPLAAEALNRLRTVVNIFYATSPSTVTIGLGQRTFVVTDGMRATFAPLAFLRINVAGDLDAALICRYVSYEQISGTLTVDVEQVFGSGTFSDWEIGPILSTVDLENLRDEIEAAAIIASNDRALSQDARMAAETARDVAISNRNETIVAHNQYLASWYGPRTTSPVGAAIGSQYLDTSITPNVVKVLTTTGWAPTVTVSIGGSRSQNFGSTVTGAGPFAVNGGFSFGDVYLNGIQVKPADIAFEPGDNGTFSLVNGLTKSATDSMTFRGYMANDAIDIYTRSEANALFGERLATSGGTVTGSISYDGPVATDRRHNFKTSGAMRWSVGAGAQPESGSNAGSSFMVARHNDAGTYVDSPLEIKRNSGQLSLTVRPAWAGVTPYDTGNLDPSVFAVKSDTYTKAQVDGGLAIKANINGPTFVGTVTLRDPTANYLAFWDENWGVRHIHFNDGTIGFLNNGGGWTWQCRNDGTTWQPNALYVGNTTLGTDGNLYLAWRGDWLSNYLGYIEGRANGAQAAADARVHRIQFAGRSEWDNQSRVAEFPTVLCDAWWTGFSVARRAATAQMHIPDQGGWVNVWA